MKKSIKPIAEYNSAVSSIFARGVNNISVAKRLLNSSEPCGDLLKIKKTEESANAYKSPIMASGYNERLLENEIIDPPRIAKERENTYMKVLSNKSIETAAPMAAICPIARSVNMIPRRIISVPK